MDVPGLGAKRARTLYALWEATGDTDQAGAALLKRHARFPSTTINS
jgi:hypothetical protein